MIFYAFPQFYIFHALGMALWAEAINPTAPQQAGRS